MVFLAKEHRDIPTKDILSWIFDEPHYDQDKAVLIDADDPSRSFSLNQARSYIRRLIAGFRHAGLQPGDCVCIQSMNDVEYPLLVLSIIGAGCIFAGTNPAYTPYELIHHIKTAKVQFVITEPELLPSIASAAKECKIPPKNIFIFHPLRQQKCSEGYQSWKDLMNHGEADWVRFNDLKTAKETTAARFFSSGTTGLPKACCNSHYNLVAQHELVYEGSNRRPYEAVGLFPLPFFHAAVGPRVHTTALKGGLKSYTMRKFDLEPFFQYHEKYGITDCNGAPPMIIAMIMSPLRHKYSLKHIKGGWSGAAPLGKGPQARIQELIGGAPFTQVYGMTEASCVATTVAWPEYDDTGSVGRPLPNLDFKLIDDDGKDITDYNVQGEICIRGPTIIPGYFENPEANAKDFDADGFYHTGDIGYCNPDSKLWYVVDRKKELIKRRAFQITPPELEALLLGHPDIVDAAIIGVPADEFEGELPRAYVVRRPGSDPSKLTEEDVKDYVGERLAKYKRPDGGVRFVDEIPKNASGKILKRILREEAKKERGQASKL